MNMIETNPTLYQRIADNHVDYSEIYRTQETLQLNKKLRRTRNTLLIAATSFIIGAAAFWIMPETSFTGKNFMIYLGGAFVMILLSMLSKKHPYYSIVSALLICIGFWGMEIFFNTIDDLLVEGSIQKLFIISLLVSSFHPSREAELIRRELLFS